MDVAPARSKGQTDPDVMFRHKGAAETGSASSTLALWLVVVGVNESKWRVQLAARYAAIFPPLDQ
jgi:hypothetical protein